MDAGEHFSSSYAQARARFLEAARAGGAALRSIPHSLAGPSGEDLAIDIARFGAPHAQKLLALSSGTHGAEGYAGSAIQTRLLHEDLPARLPADTALLLIHAVNPWGFAHGRRVNEDNVDVNRNFVSAPYPQNADYAELHEALVPRSWTEETARQGRAAQVEFVKRHGLDRLIAAFSQGQYSHPNGLFYGGAAPSWSNRAMSEIFEREIAPFGALAYFDLHTGLGERGACELICARPPGDSVYELCAEWFGSAVRSLKGGASVSTDARGTMMDALIERLESDGRPRRMAVLSIEYGTQPRDRVAEALQADNWLYAHGDPASAEGREIARKIRAAFLVEDADWAEATFAAASRHVAEALQGLAALR